MAVKYQTEFYAYRTYPLTTSRFIADPNTPLEEQIQNHVLHGHLLFHASKYAAALQSYLTAWGLLPKLVVADFPTAIGLLYPEKLLDIDITQELIQASSEILLLRDPEAPHVPIVAPVDPPDTMVAVMNQFGTEINVAERSMEAGRAHLERGDPAAATRFVRRAVASDPNNLALQAEGAALMGTIAFRQGNFDAATEQTKLALRSFKQINDAEGIAAMQRNLETVDAVTRPAQPAGGGGILSSAATRVLSGPLHVTSRPVSVTPLLVRDTQGHWLETATRRTELKASESILLNDSAVVVDLADNQAIEEKLLNVRKDVISNQALNAYLWILPQFVSYLAHVRGFVIPLAIADTYFALGDYARAETYYLKVRDYKYLNLAIERPLVWRKLARTYLAWANRLYKDRDMAGAQAKYENILKIVGNDFEVDGPLYESSFDGLRNETLQFLRSDDALAFNAIEFERRIILLTAKIYLIQILNNINYLGFSEDLVPIHTWRYLQNVARYFAKQAIQAERAYISFKDNAEQEEFTRLTLEQAVDAQQAALNVEERRVQASLEQQRVSQLSADLSQQRLDNANAQKTEYENISADLVKLEEMNGWATGPMDKAIIDESYGDILGIDPGKYDTYQITKLIARKRAQINTEYELHNMQRKIDELAASKVVADAQVDVAEKMVEVALAQRELAQLRVEQANARVEHFDAQEFTPELWDNLAQAQRELSQRYVDWAIGAAFIMERAFEVEYDLNVNRIRFDYERSELHGLLAADFLLADIDQFSYDRILQTEKQVPSKFVISLADRYPFQFVHYFQQNGRLDFETLLEDFDVRLPGAHLRKVRRVEVVIEGLVGSDGLHGTLTNAGTSHYRDRAGAKKFRVQKPETMILSRYDLRHDGFVFTADEDLLAIFENSGAASGWILDFPPSSNDIRYQDISNIHLVLYFDSYFSEAVAATVRAELAAAAIHDYSLGLGLRFQYPDAFFGLQDSGEVAFTIDDAFLPYNHLDPLITDLYFLVETDAGVAANDLTLEVETTTGNISIQEPTNENGMIQSDGAGAALDALQGEALMDTWTVRIPEAANAAAFAAGFSWTAVRNIYLFAEYQYTPRV